MQSAGWAVAALLALLMILIAWLAVTAPLSRSLKPIAPPSISLMSADSHLIARRGAIIDRPVTVAALPEHVPQAFMAIEDRRFRSHWGGSEEHKSELQSLMRISYAVFCLK